MDSTTPTTPSAETPGTPKKDLQPYKNNLMQLSYTEKIELSEWLHQEIDFERGEHVKQKGKEVTEQIGNFINKAAQVTKTAGNDMLDSFRSATAGGK